MWKLTGVVLLRVLVQALRALLKFPFKMPARLYERVGFGLY